MTCFFLPFPYCILREFQKGGHHCKWKIKVEFPIYKRNFHFFIARTWSIYCIIQCLRKYLFSSTTELSFISHVIEQYKELLYSSSLLKRISDTCRHLMSCLRSTPINSNFKTLKVLRVLLSYPCSHTIKNGIIVNIHWPLLTFTGLCPSITVLLRQELILTFILAFIKFRTWSAI